MDGITYEKIEVKGGPELTTLEKLEVYIEPNSHGQACLSGIAADERALKEYLLLKENPLVEIYFSGSLFFAGYLGKITFSNEMGLPYVTMLLQSATIRLDREKGCKSYQSVNANYAELIQKVVRKNQGGDCICISGLKTVLTKPLIQYMETDWAFIKRLASHLGTVVFPEVKSAVPRLWFGLPDSQEFAAFSGDEYILGISKKFYDLGGCYSGYRQRDFIYYEVKTLVDYQIGAKVLVNQREWKIGKKSARLVDGEVVFGYTLCQEGLLVTNKNYNSLFSGMSIFGTVLAAEGETIKLHLDMDDSQEEGQAYAYEWTPDTGSIMYCMPKKGTRAALYFSGQDEQTGRAVSCVRTNGGKNADEDSGMADVNNRGLTTEHGKKLFLKPDEVGFSSVAGGNHFVFKDDEAVVLSSGQKVNIQTAGEIRFKGKNVVLETPVEMNLVRG